MLATDAASSLELKRKRDLLKVSHALDQFGGLNSKNPPDFKNMKERKGQTVQVACEDLTIGDFEDPPERPEESTLSRVSYSDLLPPPTSDPVPLDFEVPANLPEHVKEQRIEFLLIQRPENDDAAPWDFPPPEVTPVSYTHLTLPTTPYV